MFVAFLGLTLLIGWIVVTRASVNVWNFWRARVIDHPLYKSFFEDPVGKKQYKQVKVWLGGHHQKATGPVGVLQGVFAIFWSLLLIFALIKVSS